MSMFSMASRKFATGTADGLLERIEIRHHQVDRRDAMLFHDRQIDIAPGENAAMNLRMQGLDAAVHHLPENRCKRKFSIAGIPASHNIRCVPPVESISTPSRSSEAANGARPVLSETVISALRTGAEFSDVMGLRAR